MAKTKRGNGEGSLFKRGRFWWIAYYDENGVRKTRSSSMTDRRMAQRILQDQTDRVASIRAGLLDPATERMRDAGKKTITELVPLFGAKIRSGGSTEKYAARTEKDVREFAEAENIQTLGEIRAEHAVAYLESLRKSGLSARSPTDNTMRRRVHTITR